jgi:hypothetical protein
LTNLPVEIKLTCHNDVRSRPNAVVNVVSYLRLPFFGESIHPARTAHDQIGLYAGYQILLRHNRFDAFVLLC